MKLKRERKMAALKKKEGTKTEERNDRKRNVFSEQKDVEEGGIEG